MFNSIIKICLFLTILFLCANANEQRIKENNLDKLIKLNTGDKIKDSIKQTLRMLYPNDDSVEELSSEFINKLIEETRQIYSTHYTDEEIKHMLDFYASKTGKKIIEKQHIIIKETMIVKQKIYQELMNQLEKKKNQKSNNSKILRIK